MRYLNPGKAGISVGVVLGAWHLLWITLVATGVAKPILDLVLRLHFLQFDYVLQPFVFSTAMTLVGLTFAIGMVMGAIFAVVWNWFSSPETSRSAKRPAFGSR